MVDRSELDFIFTRIDDLVQEIETQVPSNGGYQCVQFRADLAGLLVVAIAATYETCVKEILYEYAERQHVAFGSYARRSYMKINSKINVNDLCGYCEKFDLAIAAKFKRDLKIKKAAILQRTGKNIEVSFQQVLNWRHEFAHAGNRATTIEEAYQTHRFGKRVIYLFAGAFR